MIEAAEVVEDREEEAAPEPGVAFMQLEPGMCRFPLGRLADPPERFCGEPAPAGSSYCCAHRAVAYVPSRQIRRCRLHRERMQAAGRRPHGAQTRSLRRCSDKVRVIM
jgi:hypothetical protein